MYTLSLSYFYFIFFLLLDFYLTSISMQFDKIQLYIILLQMFS